MAGDIPPPAKRLFKRQARLLRTGFVNPTSRRANNWLTIKTVGTDSNRDGIGARIKLVAGGNTQIREVTAGASNKSQNMLPVHFGLGKSEIVDSIQVLWPSGTLQTLSNVAPNQVLIITEP